MLIGARVVMGLGAAFVMPATLSILNAVFPPKERPQAIAAWSAVTGIGVVIGPTLGGLLLSHFWWGSVFVINIPLVALALAGVILTVPETAEAGGRAATAADWCRIAGAGQGPASRPEPICRGQAEDGHGRSGIRPESRGGSPMAALAPIGHLQLP
jgi:MFS family permease